MRKIRQFKPKRSYSLKIMGLWVSVFAAIGITTLLLTHAATPSNNTTNLAAASTSRLSWLGQQWYGSGVNVPWYQYAYASGHGDFGGGSSDGVVANKNNIATQFAKLKDANAHMVRWWMFEGGAWPINRDGSGMPTSLNTAIYADIDAALDLANTYDLYYNFVLFSGPTSVDFPAAWRTNPTYRQKLAEVLSPLFTRYKDNPRIMSWEIFNEPEWAIWNSQDGVTANDVKALASSIISSIRTNSPSKLITVGQALIHGFNSAQKGIDLWTDIDLDFYSPHWYDANGTSGDVCALCTTATELQAKYGTNKPIVIGEYYQSPGTTQDNVDRQNQWYNQGYAGAWAWSLFNNMTSDKLPVDLAALKTFNNQHSDVGPSGTIAPPPTDTTAPTVAITQPSANANLSGSSVSLQASASDNIGVTKVEFYLDNTLLTTDTSAPYTSSVNTTSYSNGSYSLKAKAYDAAGNTTTSTIAVAISNAIPDTTLPTVSISAPIAGATISGTLSFVQATASDNVSVSKVEFYIDGNLLGTDTSSPYSFGLNTTLYTNGSHTLTAKAFDSSNNTRTSTGVTVTINNIPADTTPPSVIITAPLSGSTISGSAYNVSATASDMNGVTKVEFSIDGVLKATDTTSPFSYTLDATTLSNATHTIVAKAYDPAANSNTATVLVTVNNTVTPPPAKAADFNGDNFVDLKDLVVLLSNYGRTVTAGKNGDCNSDGKVDLRDLVILLGAYGK